MADNEIAQAWKGFDKNRRKQLIAKMSSEQKSNLRRSLESATATAPTETKSPTYLGEAVSGVGRVLSGIAELPTQLMTPHETAGATREEEVSMGPVGRLLYNIPADIENQWINAEAARQASAKSGEGKAGQLLTYGENLPIVGGMVQKAEEAGPGRVKLSPQTVGALTEAGTMASLPKATELGLKGVAKLIPKVEGIPPVKTIREGIHTLTDTTPSDIAEEVRRTSKANAIKEERVADLNAKREEIYRDKVKTVEAANAAKKAEFEAAKVKAEEIKKASAEQTTSGGNLARQVREQSARMVERVKQVKAKTKGIIDANYAKIRTATGASPDPTTGVTNPTISVPREQLADAVTKAESRLKGSSESIKLFKDILSKAPEEEPGTIEYQGAQIPKGHPLYDVLREMSAGESIPPANFADLQGYYSELGTQLAKGTLPGDLYTAFKSLQSDIGGMMKGVARKGNVSALLTSTQSLYHDYMETFNESTGPNHSGSPIAQALDAKDPDYAIKPLSNNETAARVRNDLAKFDPAVVGQGGAAQLYDNFRKTLRDFDSVNKPIKTPETPEPPKLKELPERRPLLKAKTKTFSPETIEALKMEKVAESASKMSKSGGRVGGYLASIWMLESALTGDWTRFAEISGARILYSAGKKGIAMALDNPDVAARIAKFRQEDLNAIMKLPPHQRTAFVNNMKPIIEVAKSKGITIDPKLFSIVRTSGAIGQTNQNKGNVSSALTPIEQSQ